MLWKLRLRPSCHNLARLSHYRVTPPTEPLQSHASDRVMLQAELRLKQSYPPNRLTTQTKLHLRGRGRGKGRGGGGGGGGGSRGRGTGRVGDRFCVLVRLENYDCKCKPSYASNRVAPQSELRLKPSYASTRVEPQTSLRFKQTVIIRQLGLWTNEQ